MAELFGIFVDSFFDKWNEALWVPFPAPPYPAVPSTAVSRGKHDESEAEDGLTRQPGEGQTPNLASRGPLCGPWKGLAQSPWEGVPNALSKHITETVPDARDGKPSLDVGWLGGTNGFNASVHDHERSEQLKP